MPGSAQIGNLAVNLTLETAAFQRGAKIAETRVEAMRGKFASVAKSISGLGAAFGIGLGVGAIAGLARDAFDMAAAFDESAQKMGVTVEALQELNLAAEQSGVSQESLAGAIGRMNKSVGALAQGSKPAIDAFARIGLSFDDLKGKSPDQQLRIIADALNKLPDVQERVKAGSDIMGRGFSELLPLINGGSQALDDYANKSREQGQITSDEAKQLDALSDSWDRMKTRAGIATAKVIAGMVEYVTKANEWLANWESARDRFIAAAEGLATGAVSAINSMVSGISNAITGRLNAIWEGVKAKIESVKNKFHEMYDAVVGHSYVPDMVEGIANSFAQLARIMVDPAVSATEKVAGAFQSLQGAIASILGEKTGGIFSMLTGFAQALVPLLGGLGGGKSIYPVVGGVDPLAPLPPGAASGMSGVFGGLAGVDRNVLSLNGSPIARVSRGERFSVEPANSNGGSYVINQTIAPNFAGNAATKDDLARMAVLTKSAAVQAINEQRRRR